MKKSIIAKTAAILLAAAAALSLGSCGDNDSSDSQGTVSLAGGSSSADAASEAGADPESSALTGETQTWGVYTVLVPEGWKLRQGDVLDDNDPNYCSVKKSDFSFFDFKSEKEETQKQQYENNKKTYTLNQKDLPAATIAGIEWNGFEYGDDFTPGFELYGTSNGRFLRVSGAGFKFDSPETKAILGSLKISPAEGAAESTAESSADERQPEVPADAAFAEKTKIKYNGVTFYTGDTFADIKDKLGKESKPSQKSKPCVPDAHDVEFYYYPGMIVQVNFEGKILEVSVSEEESAGGDGSTAGGLKLGDDLATVKRFLGEPTTEDEYGCTYEEGSCVLKIMLRDGSGVFIINLSDSSLPF